VRARRLPDVAPGGSAPADVRSSVVGPRLLFREGLAAVAAAAGAGNPARGEAQTFHLRPSRPGTGAGKRRRSDRSTPGKAGCWHGQMIANTSTELSPTLSSPSSYCYGRCFPGSSSTVTTT
jgi:hypothetical protein